MKSPLPAPNNFNRYRIYFVFYPVCLLLSLWICRMAYITDFRLYSSIHTIFPTRQFCRYLNANALRWHYGESLWTLRCYSCHYCGIPMLWTIIFSRFVRREKPLEFGRLIQLVVWQATPYTHGMECTELFLAFTVEYVPMTTKRVYVWQN